MTIARAAVVACLVALQSPRGAAAQLLPPPPRAATAAEVALGNMLLGGVTASTRALLSRKDPVRAFAVGAFGGVVHHAGKYIAVEPGTAYGVLGLVVAGTGTSIIGNAGRGVNPFDEVSVPVAFARLRVTPRAARTVRLTVDLTHTVIVASAFTTRDMDVDWGRSLTSGAPTFDLRRGSLVLDDDPVGGLAVGPVALVDATVPDKPALVRHELVHVHQHWYTSEAWGRPIEAFVRSRVPGMRSIPSWLELGVVPFGLLAIDAALFGDAGAKAVQEAEAYRLMRR